jgi:signal transduction histidine kinase/CheY-like chemotaxis protein
LIFFFDSIAIALKNLFFAIGCTILLPNFALAAQHASLLAPLPLFFLILSLLLLTAVCLLWMRLQRCKHEKMEVLDQLQLDRQTLDHAPWDILWVDAERKIVRTNQSAVRSAGSERQLTGCDLLELEPELRNHPFIAALPSKKTGQAVGPCISPDQEACGLHETKKLAVVTGGNKQFVVCYANSSVNDVDQETNTEQCGPANRNAFQLMESASRIKNNFIANINHEIRTPMNAIIGYAEMLAAADLGSREKRFVGIIHKSSMALVSIFNDIMELSKIDSGRIQILPSAVCLDSMLSEVMALYQELADEKGLRFLYRIETNLPPSFLLDGGRLKQVLQNLVSNAIKFTRRGFVELTVSGTPSQSTADCYDLRFQVHDSGIGIPASDQQQIFELFQQREESISKQYGGVGLGLTLCSRLLAMMGGAITLFSNEGEGACFTVTLSMVRISGQVPANPSVQKTSCAEEQGKKLLVVDDIDLIKEIFFDFFQDTPFHVLTASNGEEALTVAAAEKPDIIFMDLNLVGMNGRIVTEQLRQQPETAAIPVIVMTGDLLEKNEYAPLFDDFLQKPFRLDVLMDIAGRYAHSSQPVVPSAPADLANNEEHTFTAGIADVWPQNLEQLRQQAMSSGSLSHAASLGAAMKETGTMTNQRIMAQMGEELMLYAGEPDIMGVERLLVKLSRAVNRKPS